LQRADKRLEKYWEQTDIKVKAEQEVSFEERDGVLYRSQKHPYVNGGKPIKTSDGTNAFATSSD